MTTWFVRSALALGIALVAGLAKADDFPSRPITIMCAFAPGGSVDAALRALAQAASKRLGQPVLVENRPGAAGTLAASTIVHAQPDGYTLAQVTTGLVRQPYIVKTNFDPSKDFTYLLQVTAMEMGLVVRADSPWKTLEEFLAASKAKPGMSYGTSGVGTVQHQVMEGIAAKTGIQWTHAPYKGIAPLMGDLLGGHLNAVSDSTGWAPFVDSGKARLLAVYGEVRLKRWPQVPTLKERGFNLSESGPWGLVAPAGLRPEVQRKLHDAFQQAMQDPQFLEVLNQLGQEVRYLSGEDYRKYLLARAPIEKAVVERYGLKLQ